MSSNAIYDLALAVHARLKTQGVPVEVVYGSEIFDAPPDAPRVQFMHDDVGRDVFSLQRTAGFKTREGNVIKTARADVAIATRVRVSGASTKTGAGEHDHKGAVFQLVGEVVSAIATISHVQKMPIASEQVVGGFVPPDDAVPIEHGARYEFAFAVSGCVFETTGYIAGQPIETNLTVRGIVGEQQEIACGEGP